MRYQVLVMAKAPVPGRVKTRLCPPCTPAQAASVAAAALADTLDAVDRCGARRRVLVLDGAYPQRPGWETVTQHGPDLGHRLAHGCAATARPGLATLLVGMDTPQLDPADLDRTALALDHADAVLGPAGDGGWWLLGLRDPSHAAVLTRVPMSTSDTGALTGAALRRRGLSVLGGPVLLDVDRAADAWAVAAARPYSGFAAAVRRHVPPPVAAA